MSPPSRLLNLFDCISPTVGLAQTIIRGGLAAAFRISMDVPGWTEYEATLNETGIETWGGAIDPWTDEYCFFVASEDYRRACYIFRKRRML